MLWQEFAQHAIAVRGVPRSAVPVELDAGRLVSWARGNRDGYWRQWQGRTAQALSLPGVVGLTRWAPAWGVLGVSRLHYTIRTAQVCSKSAGGRYAGDLFDPRWHPILDECLRIRAGLPGRPRYATAAVRRRDALAFIAMVIDDGVRIG